MVNPEAITITFHADSEEGIKMQSLIYVVIVEWVLVNSHVRC